MGAPRRASCHGEGHASGSLPLSRAPVSSGRPLPLPPGERAARRRLRAPGRRGSYFFSFVRVLSFAAGANTLVFSNGSWKASATRVM